MATDAPVATYIAAAAPPGSLDHFMLLFIEARRREAAGTALALGKVILNITRQNGETDILRLKLAWWLDELEATDNASPRHPLTKALSRLAAPERWLTHLGPLITGVNAVVHTEQFDSLAALLRHAHCMAQRQVLLDAVTADAADDETLANATAAGVGIGLTELICTTDSRLPSTAFADTVSHPGAPADNIGGQLAAIAEAHFEAMTAARPARREHAAVWLQAALHRGALRRMRAAGYDPVAAASHPLRQLWQAWREARNLRT